MKEVLMFKLKQKHCLRGTYIACEVLHCLPSACASRELSESLKCVNIVFVTLSSPWAVCCVRLSNFKIGKSDIEAIELSVLF